MNRGFSLIEVMMSMALGALVLAGLATASLGVMQHLNAQRQITRQQAEGRIALLRVGRDLRLAHGVVAGHDCDLAGCMPSLASVLGSRAWAHARGTDVLSLRHVDPVGSHTIIYYIKRSTAPGTMTLAALMRCERERCDEVARGVERLDFRYAVRGNIGDTRYLDARELVARRSGWEDVIAVEVHVLVNGQEGWHGRGESMLAYAYPGEGAMRPRPPDARGPGGISPSHQGFERATLRGSFSALFALRNSAR